MSETLTLGEYDTLPKLLARNRKEFGDRHVAMREKDLGIWQSYSWEEYYALVKRLCLAFDQMGLQQGDKVAIVAENKPHAYWFELAALSLRAVVVGVFSDCTPPEIEYYMQHSEVKFAVCQDQEQVDKVLEIKDKLPLLKHVIYWDTDGMWNYRDPLLMTMEDMLKLGKAREAEHGELFESFIQRTQRDDHAVFFYSSGTTGKPKAAMVTHQTMIGMAMCYSIIDRYKEHEEYLSFLPLAWIPEQLFGVTFSLFYRYRANFPENAETVQENLREIGPQMVFFGPRLWESMLRMVQVRILDSSWLHRLTYHAAMKIGFRMADYRMRGRRPGVVLTVLNLLADAAVFRWLRDLFGLSKIRVAYTGGSAMSPEVIRYFHAIGINLKSNYGSSEVGMVTCHKDHDIKPETAGPPLPNMQIRLTDEGEIVVKVPFMFAGYYKEPQKTAERVRDGWFHTGDFGFFDSDGHLVVMDRMEDVMSLPDGKKFSPQFCEVRLRFSPYIKDVLMVARENSPLIAALINIDLDNVGKWAEQKHISFTTFADLSQKPNVIDLIRSEIARINDILPEHSRIQKFVNLHKEFDPDDSEMTRTRKLRRTFVEERYKDIIGAIYGGQPSLEVLSDIVYRDGRRGTSKSEIIINPL